VKHPDDPVPEDQELACLLWKCHYGAVYGMGDGSVTWWTLQPVERSWWIGTAERLRDSAWWRDNVEETAILAAIRLVRERAAEERVAMSDRGETLSDYSSGVLDGLDLAWLAGTEARRES
jgi:hypothetical protein